MKHGPLVFQSKTRIDIHSWPTVNSEGQGSLVCYSPRGCKETRLYPLNNNSHLLSLPDSHDHIAMCIKASTTEKSKCKSWSTHLTRREKWKNCKHCFTLKPARCTVELNVNEYGFVRQNTYCQVLFCPCKPCFWLCPPEFLGLKSLSSVDSYIPPQEMIRDCGELLKVPLTTHSQDQKW